MKINIALIPSTDVREAALIASEELAKQFQTHFVLEADGPYPHVTLYAGECRPSRKTAIVRKVGRVCETGVAAGMLCTFTGVAHHDGYLGVRIERTPPLLNLHWEIVEAVSDQRLQSSAGAEAYHMEFTPEQEENIRKYGYADVGDLYSPHLTITRFANEEDAVKAARQLEAEFDVWQPFYPQVGIFLGGEHGTCAKLLTTLSLSANR